MRPRAPAPHELRHRAFIDPQVSDPTAVLDVVLVPLQAVGPQVGLGGLEWHVTDKPKPVAQTRLGVVPIILRDASGLLGRRHLLEHGGMVAFFDAENIVQVVIVQDLNVRGIGTQAVFGDDQFQVRMVLTQFGDQPLGRIAFTVVFARAILLRDSKIIMYPSRWESGRYPLTTFPSQAGDGAAFRPGSWPVVSA